MQGYCAVPADLSAAPTAGSADLHAAVRLRHLQEDARRQSTISFSPRNWSGLWVRVVFPEAPRAPIELQSDRGLRELLPAAELGQPALLRTRIRRARRGAR